MEMKMVTLQYAVADGQMLQVEQLACCDDLCSIHC